MWIGDAQAVSGLMSWSNAVTACTNLVYPEIPDEEYEDWRLPNIKELQSLIDYSQINPPLPSDHPFVNVGASYYWTSTTYSNDTEMAWIVKMKDGSIGLGNKKTDSFYVWPVRAGK